MTPEDLMNSDFPCQYVRMDRPLTGSYVTYKLPFAMTAVQIDYWVGQNMPNWEVIMACPVNPDEV